MKSRSYRAIFPATVLDQQSQDMLTTTKGGQRFATYVGSSIAGFRADLIVFDDPMQPDDTASETAKQKVRDWFDGVVAQRLRNQETGVIVLVMHRLAPDDITATLEERGGWTPVRLPLIAVKDELFTRGREDRFHLFKRKPGELLSPTWLTAPTIEKLRLQVPAHIFEGQYQQNPQYGGSGVCSIDRFLRYKTAPPFELTIHSWDIAATKGDGDWTVCLKFGLAVDADGRNILYLIGIVRVQLELPDVTDLIVSVEKQDRPSLIVLDGNGVGRGLQQDLINRKGLRHVLPHSEMGRANVKNQKIVRFNDTYPHLYEGRILVPNALEGLDEFLKELAQFPNGKNDDQADALSHVGAFQATIINKARFFARELGRWRVAKAKKPPAPPRVSPVEQRRLNRQIGCEE
jgi:predicted phage terminase large subunit-like protein